MGAKTFSASLFVVKLPAWEHINTDLNVENEVQNIKYNKKIMLTRLQTLFTHHVRCLAIRLQSVEEKSVEQRKLHQLIADVDISKIDFQSSLTLLINSKHNF